MKWKGENLYHQKNWPMSTNKKRGKRHFDRSLGLGWIELGERGGRGGWEGPGWSWTSMVNIPIWMMITCHVLSGFYDFLSSCNGGNEGRDCAWDGLVGVNNDCTDEFKYPLFDKRWENRQTNRDERNLLFHFLIYFSSDLELG